MANQTFQTSPNTRTQFSPMIFLMRVSLQPARSIAAVRFGNSPIVRMPSGFTTLPKFVNWR